MVQVKFAPVFTLFICIKDNVTVLVHMYWVVETLDSPEIVDYFVKSTLYQISGSFAGSLKPLELY